MTVAADPFGQGRPCRFALGQPILLDPAAVALEPVGGDPLAQPGRRRLG